MSGATSVALPFVDKANTTVGLCIAVLSYILGEHWFLFAVFLFLNVADYITGCMKSTINGKINSNKGFKGILKKLCYWLMIACAFIMGGAFIEIGEMIGVDLKITTLIGWFVLSTLIINEQRSIIENFVEAGLPVPPIIVKGLDIANKAIDGVININFEKEETSVEIPLEDLKGKEQVTLQVKQDEAE